MQPNEPQFNVPEKARKATKAIWASITTGAGLIALLVNAMGDGGISSGEVGELVVGALTAVATIGAVWRAYNAPKGS